MARVREYLNHVVQEFRWAEGLNPFNHCSHFPFFMTHFTDSMPNPSISGVWSVDLWNPKYASHVFKVTVVLICWFAMGMVLLVPQVISLILKLGAMMVVIKAGLMSFFAILWKKEWNFDRLPTMWK